jgi:hypothetical protein
MKRVSVVDRAPRRVMVFSVRDEERPDAAHATETSQFTSYFPPSFDTLRSGHVAIAQQSARGRTVRDPRDITERRGAVRQATGAPQHVESAMTSRVMRLGARACVRGVTSK